MAIDLNQLQQILDNAQKSDAFKSDLKRALRKISSSLIHLTNAVDEAEAMLSDDYQPAAKKPRQKVETDPEAPFGRRRDGTPREKPGRAKQS